MAHREGASDLNPEGGFKPMTKGQKAQLKATLNPKNEPGHCPDCGADKTDLWEDKDNEQAGCDRCGAVWNL